MNEKEMHDSKAPWPESLDELSAYIKTLTDREHDYGTCVYAMSLAATAAFQYVAKRLGVTGFQASCADFDILRRTRLMEDSFILLRAEEMLYPQYDLPARLREVMDKWKPWAAEEARKKLAKATPDSVHPAVRAHWEKLAALVPAAPQEEVSRG